MKIRAIIVFVALLFCCRLSAQHVAVKTNLLYDATATANLGFEFALAPKWTLDVSGNVNAWNVKDWRTRHWLAQPEARYWLCERFNGHFFALHGLAGQYNFGHLPSNIPLLGFKDLKDFRYQGWMYGGGIGYGYSWILGKHWNLEAEIGLGYIYATYDKYPCAECGTVIDKGHKNYVGPTKIALNIEYLF